MKARRRAHRHIFDPLEWRGLSRRPILTILVLFADDVVPLFLGHITTTRTRAVRLAVKKFVLVLSYGSDCFISAPRTLPWTPVIPAEVSLKRAGRGKIYHHVKDVGSRA